jgi:hypothetical protein
MQNLVERSQISLLNQLKKPFADYRRMTYTLKHVELAKVGQKEPEKTLYSSCSYARNIG